MPDGGPAHRPFRFAPPAPGATAIPRPRLFDVLGRRFDVRLITLEAEAGLGKTTALAQALHHNDGSGRDCWLTCEPSDASASALLAALLTSIGAGSLPDAPAVEDVRDAVWWWAPERVCLVLDDVHRIDDDSPGAEVLRHLVDALPDNGHVVMAGRRLPSLPRSRLVLQNRAIELAEAHLRLDGTEEGALAVRHGVEASVIQRARGWPALAELYGRADVADAHAERFVWEEIVGVLPANDREAFLLLVAVGGAEAELLDAVCPEPFDHERIARLPLVATDAAGGLRPHPLWDELLRAHIDPEAAAAATRRLATGLLAQGNHDTAFELLASVEDWEQALPALFQACNDQRRPPWRDQLQRWRSLVPASSSDAPEVVYLEAMIAREDDPWSDATHELFVRSMASFRDRGDLISELATGVRYSYVAWIRGDIAALDSMVARLAELAEAGLPLDDLNRLNRAVVADMKGDSTAVLSILDEVVDPEPRLRHIDALLRVFARLADGDATDASDDAALAATTGAAVAPAAGTGWAAFAVPLVAWSRGDLDAALTEPLVDPGSRFGLGERVLTIASAAIMSAHIGDLEAASARLSDLDKLAPAGSGRDLAAGFRAVAQATVAVAAGDEEGARRDLARELDGRALVPAGAGRAVRWFPTVPYLLHDGSRALLDSLPPGRSREPALTAARALLHAREGGTVGDVALLRDARALVAALPAVLAVELAAHAAAEGPSSFDPSCIAALADIAPATARAVLRRLEDGPDGGAGTGARMLLSTVPIPPPHVVRIEVLGPARVLIDGSETKDPSWRRQRVRQLASALVAFREIRRDRLGVLLWPDFDEKALSANLRQTLSYLQALLEPHRDRGDAPWFLQQNAGVLRFRQDARLTVDVWELESALDAADKAAGSAAPAAELSHLCDALSHWRGEPFDDVAGEEWAEPLRERLRQRAIRAAVRAGDLFLADGQPRDAVASALVALAIDPAHEPAIRLCVFAQLAVGDRAAALNAFEAGCRALRDLGVPPEPATLDAGRRAEKAAR